MVKDDHNTDKLTGPNRATECPLSRGVSLRTVVAAAAVAAALTVAGVLVLRLVGGSRDANGQAGGPMLFQGWNNPQFVLLLSGQQHGYVLPCGCSKPQYGGLERRYNFLKSVEDRGWPVVALDLGDVPQDKAPRDLPNIQGKIKYLYSLQALSKMNYGAVGIGEYETTMPVPLERALAEYGTLGQQTPVVSSNLTRDKNIVFQNETSDWKLVDVPGTKMKVAVVSVVGKDVAAAIMDKNVVFDSVTSTLQGVPNDPNKPGLLKAIQQSKPDLQVLMYQGPVEDAKKCAQAFPNFNVVLYNSKEDEPPGRPDTVVHKNNSTTMLVSVGHKGKNVGVVGCFAGNGGQANGFDLRYQMVRLDPQYETPPEKEKGHPIVELMESYTKELKDKDYLSKYPQTLHQFQGQAQQQGLAMPSFVGSEKCKNCHPAAYKVWKDSGHAHAYQTLVDAKKPSLRQFDAECIVCHVVGFGYKTGFEGFEHLDPKLPENAQKIERQKKLIDVGCESCHGPASEHVRNTNNEDWHKKLNPWKYDKAKAQKDPAWEKRRVLELDKFCQKCHDQDNDVHWDYNLKWPKVEHHTPERQPEP
jgi:hypothetical protein